MVPTRPVVLWLCCAGLVASAAVAQTGASINCAAASGVAEAMICSDAYLGASDGRLAERFDTAMIRLEEQGADGEEAAAALRESQAEWTEARDACRGEPDARGCVARAYAMREAELVAAFELEEPASAVTYTCRSAGGAEVSISFYDLDTPAVRIQSGDEVTAGARVATPSGAKYRLSSGQELWVRKDVARFTAPGGASQTCETSGD